MTDLYFNPLFIILFSFLLKTYVFTPVSEEIKNSICCINTKHFFTIMNFLVCTLFSHNVQAYEKSATDVADQD